MAPGDSTRPGPGAAEEPLTIDELSDDDTGRLADHHADLDLHPRPRPRTLLRIPGAADDQGLNPETGAVWPVNVLQDDRQPQPISRDRPCRLDERMSVYTNADADRHHPARHHAGHRDPPTPAPRRRAMTDDEPRTARDTGSRSGDASGAADTVTELTPESTGRWVLTSRGSHHLIDLDQRTYERRPGPDSQDFPYDRMPMELLRIDAWPKVGERMLIWLQDPTRCRPRALADLLNHQKHHQARGPVMTRAHARRPRRQGRSSCRCWILWRDRPPTRGGGDG